MSGGRPGKYLFKRKGSNNWWLRFQYTGDLAKLMGKKRELSLKTTDYDEARLRAHDEIRGHLTMLVMFRKGAFPSIIKPPAVTRRFEPNQKYFNEQGEEFWATADELIFVDEQGKPVRKESNSHIVLPQEYSKEDLKELAPYLSDNKVKGDEAFIHRWIEKRDLNKHIEQEALSTWRVFRKLTNSKPLRLCKRSDGVSLVKKLYEMGNRSATVGKKIGHLRAAVNVAMTENSENVNINPFQGVFENRNDEIMRVDLSDNDMRIIRSSLSMLRETDQILWKLLAQTGMRLDEPFQIREVLFKDGIKCVHVGTKTKASDRFVPIPSELVSIIPDQLSRNLFSEPSETVGKRIRYFLRKIGISYDSVRGTGDARKTIHSLRHRAKDRLRDLECPEDIQLAILGHKSKSTSDRYGTGYSMKIRLKYIDQIGY